MEHSVNSKTAPLFEVIPDNFFSPLSSQNQVGVLGMSVQIVFSNGSAAFFWNRA